MYSYRSASRETEKLAWVAFHLWENSAQLSHINSSGKVCYAGYWKVNFRWQGSKDSNLNNDQNNMQLNIYIRKFIEWQKLFCTLLLSLCQKVSCGISKEKRKEKKERKKEAAHVIKKYIYSKAKLVKLKVPVINQDPDSSHIFFGTTQFSPWSSAKTSSTHACSYYLVQLTFSHLLLVNVPLVPLSLASAQVIKERKKHDS